jgi:hypothetical protein
MCGAASRASADLRQGSKDMHIAKEDHQNIKMEDFRFATSQLSHSHSSLRGRSSAWLKIPLRPPYRIARSL